MTEKSATRFSAESYEPTTIASTCQAPIPAGLQSETVFPRDDFSREKDVERDLDETMSADSGLIEGPPLSQKKKYCLLALFCLGVFMDGESTIRVSRKLTR